MGYRRVLKYIDTQSDTQMDCIMKYLQMRNNRYYYRRRIPTSLLDVATIKVIFRPLSTEKKLALKIAEQYNHLFNMIDLSLKLKEDITQYVEQLNLLQEDEEAKIDVYTLYLRHQDVSDKRRTKIERLLATIQILLPNNLEKLTMTQLDTIKQSLSVMPRRNIQKYKILPLSKLVKMEVPEEDRMSGETVNDHLKTLNSLVKFAYERDYLSKPYAVSMVKKTTAGRDERVALDVDTIKYAITTAKTARLADSFTLLYLSGLRPSEVHKCKISTVDGVKCFDLTDKSLELKSKGSYRLIPVHHAIKEPERLLESFRSMSSQYINRLFNVPNGTLYSLRHSFATELASKGVEPHIISELLGHSHSGMTLSRYVKGFPVKILKRAIDSLSLAFPNSSLLTSGGRQKEKSKRVYVGTGR